MSFIVLWTGSEYYGILAPISAELRIAVECESASSLIMQVEAGRGIARAPRILKLAAGRRLLYRSLTGTTETQSVGIAPAAKGEVTPASEKVCEIFGAHISSETQPSTLTLVIRGFGLQEIASYFHGTDGGAGGVPLCGKPMWARGSDNIDSPCASCDCGNRPRPSTSTCRI